MREFLQESIRSSQTDDSVYYTLVEYRQTILSILIKVSIAAGVGLTILNLLDLLRPPSSQVEIENMIMDLCSLSILLTLWYLLGKGHTLLTGVGFITLTFFAGLLSYPYPYFSQSLMMLAVPVVISSFLIQAWASLPLAFITIGFYSLAAANVGFSYDLIAVLALGTLSLGAFLVANTLNQTIRNLVNSYDETIRSWALALEMRDSETLGHSKRVVDLTLQLAREMGVKEHELTHIRRGALLHDVGKMAVPDSILHNSGQLTPMEWEEMRKHPAYARDYLQKVPYLKQALDIPYCHHEKWDGSGYPRGLKGEQIPLPARIFAIVDVWDALTHDRPYRTAWKTEQAIEHITGLSGQHFDPHVVQGFVTMLQRKGERERR